jgi:hypothetical protein
MLQEPYTWAVSLLEVIIASLIGYCDSDLASDVDTRSTTRVGYFLGRNLASWQSQKQKVVTLSTCETEYIAVATAACQGV